VLLLSLRFAAGDSATNAGNAQNSAFSPAHGENVWAAWAEEPMRATRRSNPLTCPRRNGGRHSGSQDVVSLRGRTEQFEPWSVRLVCRGLVPGRQTHRRQRVSSGRMRRGTSSACAKRPHSSRSAQQASPRSRTRPSLGPETRATSLARFSSESTHGRDESRRS